jgi:hypothetical protein
MTDKISRTNGRPLAPAIPPGGGDQDGKKDLNQQFEKGRLT